MTHSQKGVAVATSGVREVITLSYDGSVYTGQVLKHGFGTEVDKHGNRYEGQWSMDEKSGQGKLTFIDGSTYEGSWKQGKFHGQGTLTYGESSMLTLNHNSSLNNVTGTTSDQNQQEKADTQTLEAVREADTLRAQSESEKFNHS